MSECPSPNVAASAPVPHPQALTPEVIEGVLADFRTWLRELAVADGVALPPAPVQEPIDLHTLLAQLTALRHEVNLQTRAARSQQEQNAEALQQLGQAFEMLRQVRQRTEQTGQAAEDELLRPLL